MVKRLLKLAPGSVFLGHPVGIVGGEKNLGKQILREASGRG
jgi:hypothetical protein